MCGMKHVREEHMRKEYRPVGDGVARERLELSTSGL